MEGGQHLGMEEGLWLRIDGSQWLGSDEGQWLKMGRN